MSLRWGILSTAHITDALLDSDSGQEFVAVGSRDLARAQAWAAEREVPRAYGSYEEVLADPEVDAVYNPLPNARHIEWSIRALEAGKHVLCEKPLAATRRGGARLRRGAGAGPPADRGVHVAPPPAGPAPGRAHRAPERSANCGSSGRPSPSPARTRRTSACPPSSRAAR